MKFTYKLVFLLLFFISKKQYAQHHSSLDVELNTVLKTLIVNQEMDYYNQTGDSLTSIVLNDWNNSYSSKTTPLAKRFSDEFYRAFHLANEKDRGGTKNLTIKSVDGNKITWERNEKNQDYVTVYLSKKLAPNEKIKLVLSYTAKIPNAKFTHFGFTEKGEFILKDWFLTPARYQDHEFVKESNLNLDDIANAPSNLDIQIKISNTASLTTDLALEKTNFNESFDLFKLKGINRTDFTIVIEPKSTFVSYKNEVIEVLTNLNGSKADEIQKARAVDRVVNFTKDWIGNTHHKKIIVSKVDYDRNPFYGLNQLPAFLAPFSDEFLFEIKFLKTYLHSYLKNNLKLNPRKDNWIYDGIQIYAMIRYIEKYHPESKMTGKISKMKLLKGFHLFNLDFNEQYSYFYLLMARKNLDQAIGLPKNELIKFNEQISNKYRAGLSLVYLDNYLENNLVQKSINQFNNLNIHQQTDRKDFETILKSNSNKDIQWFFETIVNTRKAIDYKFFNVSRTKDSVSFRLKNKTNCTVPIPVYGLKRDSIVFKKWIEPLHKDSLYFLERKNANRIIINYKNEVPEFNLRNNWNKIEGLNPINRPFKFAFIKDLENPYYNQIIYTPVVTFNIYDGLSPGVRFHNRTILNRPFVYDLNPTYSTRSKTLTGSGVLMYNQDYRESSLFRIKYVLSSSYFHYAQDATYFKLNPMVLFQFRNDDFRVNQNQYLLFRQVIIHRDKSNFVLDSSVENYSVFNAKFRKSKTEITKHSSIMGETQFSAKFGKVIGEIEYRRLFEDNRQLNFRLFSGLFTYNNTNSNFYSFALDRPTDYLFDYAYLGRSTQTGTVSQEFIMAEGGFKSKLANPFANQWMTTLNASYSIWNWVEAYGDLGLIKSRNQNEKLVYDAGIRLNFLPDYFELYFPMYSNNGWEIAQPKYNQKIRFIVTLNPNRFLELFTRKWF